jgi:hypothetical protein
MTAQAVKLTVSPILKIEKGAGEYRQEVKQFATIAWQIAYTALWNTLEFSALEKETAINSISNFLQQGSSHKKAYAELVQRVLLARQYINTHPGTYIPVPSRWFGPENKNGFAGTHKWYAAVQQMRQSLPLYKQSLKAFPEAVCETLQSDKAADFHYWRSYFIQHNAQGLLNLYLSTIANSMLNNTADKA